LELVADASVLIDLHNGELTIAAFSLPHHWVTPDVIAHQLQRPSFESLEKAGLQVIELSPGEVDLVSDLSATYKKPGRQDLFALALAKSRQMTLIAGDKDLRNAAEAEKVPVHGTLWVLDQLVNDRYLPPAVAVSSLSLIVERGARLPQPEITARLRLWQGRHGEE